MSTPTDAQRKLKQAASEHGVDDEPLKSADDEGMWRYHRVEVVRDELPQRAMKAVADRMIMEGCTIQCAPMSAPSWLPDNQPVRNAKLVQADARLLGFELIGRSHPWHVYWEEIAYVEFPNELPAI